MFRELAELQSPMEAATTPAQLFHCQSALGMEERDGLVPDALLRRPTELDARYKDHLHDVKIIHMGPSTYSDAMVKEKGIARGANARANKVNGQYLTKARKLDTECFSSEPDVEARPVLRKLRSFPRVRGQCVQARLAKKSFFFGQHLSRDY